MSKQIYIDENGNEVLVSGTVNSADVLPIEAGNSIMTKAAIDAKANESNFAIKSYATPNALSIQANSIDTQTFTVNDNKYRIIVGFAITNTTEVVPMQIYFDGDHVIQARVRNLSSSNQTYKITIFYI